MKNLDKVYVVTTNGRFEWNVSKEKMQSEFESTVKILTGKGLIFVQLSEVDVTALNIPVNLSLDQTDIITEYIDNIAVDLEEKKIGIRLNAFLDEKEAIHQYGEVNKDWVLI